MQIVAGFDIWALAGDVFKDNFPEAKFYRRNLEYVDPRDLLEEIKHIDLILASPECTNHSPARGKREKSEKSRETAFHVLRFARAFEPRWIIIENVVNMKKWDRYGRFLKRLEALDYKVVEQTINSSDFGVPQSRKRLFIICSRDGEVPIIDRLEGARRNPARQAIDYNGRYPFSPLKKRGRAKATLKRAARAIKALGPRGKFLLVYYGSDGAGGWQRLSVPLRTVTTLDRFAFVRPAEDGHEMRMLQVPELLAAMGFPPNFRLEHGSRRDKIHLLGNAVCPPVINAIVSSLVLSKRGERTARR